VSVTVRGPCTWQVLFKTVLLQLQCVHITGNYFQAILSKDI
jgi:hypothetical protein